MPRIFATTGRRERVVSSELEAESPGARPVERARRALFDADEIEHTAPLLATRPTRKAGEA
jgi:hypothetical protein